MRNLRRVHGEGGLHELVRLPTHFDLLNAREVVTLEVGHVLQLDRR
jgi:hypothetical protein